MTLPLSTAVDVVPDIAPLLVLVAVTGVRRGELVAIRRSAVNWNKRLVTFDSAVTSSGKVKATKTYLSRTFHIDATTVAMLQRHCDQMDATAKAVDVELDPDPFLFSAAPDSWRLWRPIC